MSGSQHSSLHIFPFSTLLYFFASFASFAPLRFSPASGHIAQPPSSADWRNRRSTGVIRANSLRKASCPSGETSSQ
jgi:hypothetical protein